MIMTRADRFTIGMAAACALFMALAGASPLAAKDPVVIRMWDYSVHDKMFRKRIFAEFSKANPDIKMEYTSQIGSVYNTTIDAAFRTKSPPEMFAGAGSLSKMVEMGWIMPLDDVAPSKEELDRFKALFPEDKVPFLDGSNMLNGKTYTWPAKGDTAAAYCMLYWNVKLFREAGLKGPSGGPAVPETWEEMRLFARKVTELDPGKTYGIIFGAKDPAIWKYNLFYTLAFAAGWSVWNWGFDWRTGFFDYHHPGFRRAIQLWLDIKKDGSVFPGELSMDDEQARFKFSQDLVGMYIGGHWTPGGLISINPDLEFDNILSPTEKRGERKGNHSAGVLADNCMYVVSSRVTNREAVWRVINFMVSPQYQEGWVKAGGGISVFPEYNKTEFFPHPALAKIAQIGAASKVTFPGYSVNYNRTGELCDPGKPDIFQTMEGQWVGRLGWEAWDDYERRANEAWDRAMIEAGKKYGITITRAEFTFPDWDPAKPYIPAKAKK